MHVTGEAFLDGATGRWFGAIRIYMNDGGVEEIHRTEEQYKTRARAEEVVVKLLQSFLEEETDED